MQIDILQAAELLCAANYITILAHERPDGDTLGSSFGLHFALQQAGKHSRVLCSDGCPKKYRFLTGDYTPAQFDEQLVVASDIASVKLLGSLEQSYAHRVDLCIDHHKSNEQYAKYNLVRPGASATCELMCRVVENMGVELTPQIATALYTGLSTDTGCFRFANATAATYRCAATLIDAGADHAGVNRMLFETVSLARMQVELDIKGSLELYCNGRLAVMYLTREMLQGTGLNEYDLEGTANLPRQLEGVEVGVLIKQEQGAEQCRVSLRSASGVDVSAIAATFGGGGHIRAAGCTIPGSPAQVRDSLVAALSKVLC